MTGNTQSRVLNWRWIRIIAWITLIAFTTNSVAWADGGVRLPSSSSTFNNSKSASHNSANSVRSVLASESGSALRLPVELGTISKRFAGTRPGTVFILQDLHINEQAQRRLASILKYLAKRQGLKNVYLEGSEGELFTDPFWVVPSRKSRKKIADYFLREGRLSGPEYLATVETRDLRLIGIENRSLYQKNREAYLATRELDPQSLPALATLDQALNDLALRMLTREALNVVKRRQAFELDTEDFASYLRFLVSLEEATPARMKRYRQLTAFLQATRLEKRLDLAGAAEALEKIEKDPAALVSAGDESALLEIARKYHTHQIRPADYYAFLEKMLHRKMAVAEKGVLEQQLGVPLRDLVLFLRYLQLYGRVNAGILDELEHLEEDLAAALCRSDEEKRLVRLFTVATTLRKIFNFKFSKQDAEFFYGNRHEFTAEHLAGVLKPMLEKINLTRPLAGFETFDAQLKTAGAYYDAALERDEVLAQNTVQKMEKTGDRVAALVAGGFHTPGIEDYLQKHGYSFAVITPRVGQINAEKEGRLYEQAMRRVPLPLEAFLMESFFAPRSPIQGDPSFQLPPWRMMPGRADFFNFLAGMRTAQNQAEAAEFMRTHSETLDGIFQSLLSGADFMFDNKMPQPLVEAIVSLGGEARETNVFQRAWGGMFHGGEYLSKEGMQFFLFPGNFSPEKRLVIAGFGAEGRNEIYSRLGISRSAGTLIQLQDGSQYLVAWIDEISAGRLRGKADVRIPFVIPFMGLEEPKHVEPVAAPQPEVAAAAAQVLKPARIRAGIDGHQRAPASALKFNRPARRGAFAKRSEMPQAGRLETFQDSPRRARSEMRAGDGSDSEFKPAAEPVVFKKKVSERRPSLVPGILRFSPKTLIVWAVLFFTTYAVTFSTPSTQPSKLPPQAGITVLQTQDGVPAVTEEIPEEVKDLFSQWDKARLDNARKLGELSRAEEDANRKIRELEDQIQKAQGSESKRAEMTALSQKITREETLQAELKGLGSYAGAKGARVELSREDLNALRFLSEISAEEKARLPDAMKNLAGDTLVLRKVSAALEAKNGLPQSAVTIVPVSLSAAGAKAFQETLKDKKPLSASPGMWLDRLDRVFEESQLFWQGLLPKAEQKEGAALTQKAALESYGVVVTLGTDGRPAVTPFSQKDFNDGNFTYDEAGGRYVFRGADGRDLRKTVLLGTVALREMRALLRSYAGVQDSTYRVLRALEFAPETPEKTDVGVLANLFEKNDNYFMTASDLKSVRPVKLMSAAELKEYGVTAKDGDYSIQRTTGGLAISKKISANAWLLKVANKAGEPAVYLVSFTANGKAVLEKQLRQDGEVNYNEARRVLTAQEVQAAERQAAGETALRMARQALEKLRKETEAEGTPAERAVSELIRTHQEEVRKRDALAAAQSALQIQMNEQARGPALAAPAAEEAVQVSEPELAEPGEEAGMDEDMPRPRSLEPFDSRWQIPPAPVSLSYGWVFFYSILAALLAIISSNAAVWGIRRLFGIPSDPELEKQGKQIEAHAQLLAEYGRRIEQLEREPGSTVGQEQLQREVKTMAAQLALQKTELAGFGGRVKRLEAWQAAVKKNFKGSVLKVMGPFRKSVEDHLKAIDVQLTSLSQSVDQRFGEQGGRVTELEREVGELQIQVKQLATRLEDHINDLEIHAPRVLGIPPEWALRIERLEAGTGETQIEAPEVQAAAPAVTPVPVPAAEIVPAALPEISREERKAKDLAGQLAALTADQSLNYIVLKEIRARLLERWNSIKEKVSLETAAEVDAQFAALKKRIDQEEALVVNGLKKLQRVKISEGEKPGLSLRRALDESGLVKPGVLQGAKGVQFGFVAPAGWENPEFGMHSFSLSLEGSEQPLVWLSIAPRESAEAQDIFHNASKVYTFEHEGQNYLVAVYPVDFAGKPEPNPLKPVVLAEESLPVEPAAKAKPAEAAEKKPAPELEQPLKPFAADDVEELFEWIESRKYRVLTVTVASDGMIRNLLVYNDKGTIYVDFNPTLTKAGLRRDEKLIRGYRFNQPKPFSVAQKTRLWVTRTFSPNEEARYYTHVQTKSGVTVSSVKERPVSQPETIRLAQEDIALKKRRAAMVKGGAAAVSAAGLLIVAAGLSRKEKEAAETALTTEHPEFQRFEQLLAENEIEAAIERMEAADGIPLDLIDEAQGLLWEKFQERMEAGAPKPVLVKMFYKLGDGHVNEAMELIRQQPARFGLRLVDFKPDAAEPVAAVEAKPIIVAEPELVARVEPGARVPVVAVPPAANPQAAAPAVQPPANPPANAAGLQVAQAPALQPKAQAPAGVITPDPESTQQILNAQKGTENERIRHVANKSTNALPKKALQLLHVDPKKTAVHETDLLDQELAFVEQFMAAVGVGARKQDPKDIRDYADHLTNVEDKNYTAWDWYRYFFAPLMDEFGISTRVEDGNAFIQHRQARVNLIKIFATVGARVKRDADNGSLPSGGLARYRLIFGSGRFDGFDATLLDRSWRELETMRRHDGTQKKQINGNYSLQEVLGFAYERAMDAYINQTQADYLALVKNKVQELVGAVYAVGNRGYAPADPFAALENEIGMQIRAGGNIGAKMGEFFGHFGSARALLNISSQVYVASRFSDPFWDVRQQQALREQGMSNALNLNSDGSIKRVGGRMVQPPNRLNRFAEHELSLQVRGRFPYTAERIGSLKHLYKHRLFAQGGNMQTAAEQDAAVIITTALGLPGKVQKQEILNGGEAMQRAVKTIQNLAQGKSSGRSPVVEFFQDIWTAAEDFEKNQGKPAGQVDLNDTFAGIKSRIDGEMAARHVIERFQKQGRLGYYVTMGDEGGRMSLLGREASAIMAETLFEFRESTVIARKIDEQTIVSQFMDLLEKDESWKALFAKEFGYMTQWKDREGRSVLELFLSGEYVKHFGMDNAERTASNHLDAMPGVLTAAGLKDLVMNQFRSVPSESKLYLFTILALIEENDADWNGYLNRVGGHAQAMIQLRTPAGASRVSAPADLETILVSENQFERKKYLYGLFINATRDMLLNFYKNERTARLKEAYDIAARRTLRKIEDEDKIKLSLPEIGENPALNARFKTIFKQEVETALARTGKKYDIMTAMRTPLEQLLGRDLFLMDPSYEDPARLSKLAEDYMERGMSRETILKVLTSSNRLMQDADLKKLVTDLALKLDQGEGHFDGTWIFDVDRSKDIKTQLEQLRKAEKHFGFILALGERLALAGEDDFKREIRAALELLDRPLGLDDVFPGLVLKKNTRYDQIMALTREQENAKRDAFAPGKARVGDEMHPDDNRYLASDREKIKKLKLLAAIEKKLAANPAAAEKNQLELDRAALLAELETLRAASDNFFTRDREGQGAFMSFLLGTVSAAKLRNDPAKRRLVAEKDYRVLGARSRFFTDILIDYRKPAGRKFELAVNGVTKHALDWAFETSAGFYPHVFPPDTPLPERISDPDALKRLFGRQPFVEGLVGGVVAFAFDPGKVPARFDPESDPNHLQWAQETIKAGLAASQNIVTALGRNQDLRDQLLRVTFESAWVEFGLEDALDPANPEDKAWLEARPLVDDPANPGQKKRDTTIKDALDVIPPDAKRADGTREWSHRSFYKGVLQREFEKFEKSLLFNSRLQGKFFGEWRAYLRSIGLGQIQQPGFGAEHIAALDIADQIANAPLQGRREMFARVAGYLVASRSEMRGTMRKNSSEISRRGFIGASLAAVAGALGFSGSAEAQDAGAAAAQGLPDMANVLAMAPGNPFWAAGGQMLAQMPLAGPVIPQAVVPQPVFRTLNENQRRRVNYYYQNKVTDDVLSKAEKYYTALFGVGKFPPLGKAADLGLETNTQVTGLIQGFLSGATLLDTEDADKAWIEYMAKIAVLTDMIQKVRSDAVKHQTIYREAQELADFRTAKGAKGRKIVIDPATLVDQPEAQGIVIGWTEFRASFRDDFETSWKLTDGLARQIMDLLRVTETPAGKDWGVNVFLKTAAKLFYVDSGKTRAEAEKIVDDLFAKGQISLDWFRLDDERWNFLIGFTAMNLLDSNRPLTFPDVAEKLSPVEKIARHTRNLWHLMSTHEAGIRSFYTGINRGDEALNPEEPVKALRRRAWGQYAARVRMIEEAHGKYKLDPADIDAAMAGILRIQKAASEELTRDNETRPRWRPLEDAEIAYFYGLFYLGLMGGQKDDEGEPFAAMQNSVSVEEFFELIAVIEGVEREAADFWSRTFEDWKKQEAPAPANAAEENDEKRGRPAWLTLEDISGSADNANDLIANMRALKQRVVQQNEAVARAILTLISERHKAPENRLNFEQLKKERLQSAKDELFLQSVYMRYHVDKKGIPERLSRGDISPYLNQIQRRAATRAQAAKVFKYEGMVRRGVQDTLPKLAVAEANKRLAEKNLPPLSAKEEMDLISRIAALTDAQGVGFAGYMVQRQDLQARREGPEYMKTLLFELDYLGVDHAAAEAYVNAWIEDAAFVVGLGFAESKIDRQQYLAETEGELKSREEIEGFILPFYILNAALKIFREQEKSLKPELRQRVKNRFGTIFKQDLAYRDLNLAAADKDLNQLRLLRVTHYVIYGRTLPEAEEARWLGWWAEIAKGIRAAKGTPAQVEWAQQEFMARMMSTRQLFFETASSALYDKAEEKGEKIPDLLDAMAGPLERFENSVAPDLIRSILGKAAREKRIRDKGDEKQLNEKRIQPFYDKAQRNRKERKENYQKAMSADPLWFDEQVEALRQKAAQVLDAKTAATVDRPMLSFMVGKMVELGYSQEEALLRFIELPRVHFPKIYEQAMGKAIDFEEHSGEVMAYTDAIFTQWGFPEALKGDAAIQKGFKDALADLKQRLERKKAVHDQLESYGGEYADHLLRRDALATRISGDMAENGLTPEDIKAWTRVAIFLRAALDLLKLNVSTQKGVPAGKDLDVEDEEILFRADSLLRLGVADLYERRQKGGLALQKLKDAVKKELADLLPSGRGKKAAPPEAKNLAAKIYREWRREPLLEDAVLAARENEIITKIAENMARQGMNPADLKLLMDEARALIRNIDEVRHDIQTRSMWEEAAAMMPPGRLLEVMIYLDERRPDRLKRIGLLDILFKPAMPSDEVLRLEYKVGNSLHEAARQRELVRMKQVVPETESKFFLHRWLNVEESGFDGILKAAAGAAVAKVALEHLASGKHGDPMKGLVPDRELKRWSPNQLFRTTIAFFEFLTDFGTFFMIFWNLAAFNPYASAFSPLAALVFLSLTFYLIRIFIFMTIAQTVVYKQPVFIAGLWSAAVYFFTKAFAPEAFTSLLSGSGVVLNAGFPTVWIALALYFILLVRTSHWFKKAQKSPDGLGIDQEAFDGIKASRNAVVDSVTEETTPFQKSPFDSDPTPILRDAKDTNYIDPTSNFADIYEEDEANLELRPWLPGGNDEASFREDFQDKIHKMAVSLGGNNDRHNRAVLQMNHNNFAVVLPLVEMLAADVADESKRYEYAHEMLQLKEDKATGRSREQVIRDYLNAKGIPAGLHDAIVLHVLEQGPGNYYIAGMPLNRFFEVVREEYDKHWHQFTYLRRNPDGSLERDGAGNPVEVPGYHRFMIQIMPGGRKPVLAARMMRQMLWGEDGSEGAMWGQKEYEHRIYLDPKDPDYWDPSQFKVTQIKMDSGKVYHVGLPHLAKESALAAGGEAAGHYYIVPPNFDKPFITGMIVPSTLAFGKGGKKYKFTNFVPWSHAKELPFMKVFEPKTEGKSRIRAWVNIDDSNYGAPGGLDYLYRVIANHKLEYGDETQFSMFQGKTGYFQNYTGLRARTLWGQSGDTAHNALWFMQRVWAYEMDNLRLFGKYAGTVEETGELFAPQPGFPLGPYHTAILLDSGILLNWLEDKDPMIKTQADVNMFTTSAMMGTYNSEDEVVSNMRPDTVVRWAWAREGSEVKAGGFWDNLLTLDQRAMDFLYSQNRWAQILLFAPMMLFSIGMKLLRVLLWRFVSGVPAHPTAVKYLRDSLMAERAESKRPPLRHTGNMLVERPDGFAVIIDDRPLGPLFELWRSFTKWIVQFDVMQFHLRHFGRSVALDLRGEVLNDMVDRGLVSVGIWVVVLAMGYGFVSFMFGYLEVLMVNSAWWLTLVTMIMIVQAKVVAPLFERIERIPERIRGDVTGLMFGAAYAIIAGIPSLPMVLTLALIGAAAGMLIDHLSGGARESSRIKLAFAGGMVALLLGTLLGPAGWVLGIAGTAVSLLGRGPVVDFVRKAYLAPVALAHTILIDIPKGTAELTMSNPAYVALALMQPYQVARAFRIMSRVVNEVKGGGWNTNPLEKDTEPIWKYFWRYRSLFSLSAAIGIAYVGGAVLGMSPFWLALIGLGHGMITGLSGYMSAENLKARESVGITLKVVDELRAGHPLVALKNAALIMGESFKILFVKMPASWFAKPPTNKKFNDYFQVVESRWKYGSFVREMFVYNLLPFLLPLLAGMFAGPIAAFIPLHWVVLASPVLLASYAVFGVFLLGVHFKEITIFGKKFETDRLIPFVEWFIGVAAIGVTTLIHSPAAQPFFATYLELASKMPMAIASVMMGGDTTVGLMAPFLGIPSFFVFIHTTIVVGELLLLASGLVVSTIHALHYYFLKPVEGGKEEKTETLRNKAVAPVYLSSLVLTLASIGAGLHFSAGSERTVEKPAPAAVKKVEVEPPSVFAEGNGLWDVKGFNDLERGNVQMDLGAAGKHRELKVYYDGEQIFTVKGNGYIRLKAPNTEWGTSVIATLGYWKDGKYVHNMLVSSAAFDYEKATETLIVKLALKDTFDVRGEVTLRISGPGSPNPGVEIHSKYTALAEGLSFDWEKGAEAAMPIRTSSMNIRYRDEAGNLHRVYDANTVDVQVPGKERVIVPVDQKVGALLFEKPLPLPPNAVFTLANDGKGRPSDEKRRPDITIISSGPETVDVNSALGRSGDFNEDNQAGHIGMQPREPVKKGEVIFEGNFRVIAKDGGKPARSEMRQEKTVNPKLERLLTALSSVGAQSGASKVLQLSPEEEALAARLQTLVGETLLAAALAKIPAPALRQNDNALYFLEFDPARHDLNFLQALKASLGSTKLVLYGDYEKLSGVERVQTLAAMQTLKSNEALAGLDFELPQTGQTWTLDDMVARHAAKLKLESKDGVFVAAGRSVSQGADAGVLQQVVMGAVALAKQYGIVVVGSRAAADMSDRTLSLTDAMNAVFQAYELITQSA